MILYKGGQILSEGETISLSFDVAAGEKLSLVLVAEGGGDASLDFSINGEGADVQLKGLYLCSGEDRLNVHIGLRHNAGGSISNQLFRGIVDGNARATFDGRIVVAHDAQKTEAYQTNQNLQLSDTAIVQTSPQLEIYADDVKCSHGATVGSLDLDEQFYMRSRGISESEARRLQMISFISPVIEDLSEELRDRYCLFHCFLSRNR